MDGFLWHDLVCGVESGHSSAIFRVIIVAVTDSQDELSVNNSYNFASPCRQESVTSATPKREF